MVERAADIATEKPTRAPRSSETAAISKHSGNPPCMVHIGPTKSGNSEIDNLLASFETAARQAHLSGQSSMSKDTIDAAHFVQSENEDEDLPDIPVYRRSKLEVYKRAPSGELMKVREE